MKTQTTQLSLFETNKITGGINLESPLQSHLPGRPATWIERPYVFITQAQKETGGRFNIVD